MLAHWLIFILTTKKQNNLTQNHNFDSSLFIMVYHILNGDALAFSFPDAGIDGDIIVMREALIDGDLSGNNLDDFWVSRAAYHGTSTTQYHNDIVKEFEKIMNAPEDAQFNLWFEYDLFCQVNMWFVISILSSLSIKKKVYAVYTAHLDRSDKNFWNGFGPANAGELAACFADRILLNHTHLQLGEDLWAAYKQNNPEALTRLATNQSPAFPYLQEVIQAHVDRFPKDGTKGRPESVLADIIQNISTDFNKVCKAFWSRESIYGFGDTQVKELYDKVMQR